LAEKLAIFEYSLSEEYSTLQQLQALHFVSFKVYISYGIDIENARDVFASIINDKKNHRELLFKIIEYLTEQAKTKIHNSGISVPTLGILHQDIMKSALPNAWV
jgi:hypothetical protein